uniref:Uncharacterized protein n=1 Tax=Anguilla anguilla TaxID=7936 RepID=A0A0E9RIE3_ANGAN
MHGKEKSRSPPKMHHYIFFSIAHFSSVLIFWGFFFLP